MTHTQKRKIVVAKQEYEWCIRGDALYAEHAAIYKPNINGTALHLDILPWDVEIRPKTISEVVEFALKNSWNPEAKGQPLRIGFTFGQYVILPKGVANSHEYEETLNK
ncbi:hypothetical protein FKG94_28280 [Exilibacterium tricleocarpae]|uniref:Uncharacterized protein n=1 Tax=Exilibacterium tricleocarpae TaxID=2591008 RepID=A0A545SL38_9GAMM|nr:hypothetical protein [Exilibacterium tricleocarpae]TQV65700.1 hypothetical protein FKG94_28280 [Exilibacterium tricleocarpae]